MITVLATLRAIWIPDFPAAGMIPYVTAVTQLVDWEFAMVVNRQPSLPDLDAQPEAALHAALLGLVLGERAMVAFRRLALEDRARRRWADAADAAATDGGAKDTAATDAAGTPPPTPPEAPPA